MKGDVMFIHFVLSFYQINFIDYGNSEWVGHDQMRADIAEFTNVPQQTFLCTLHDITPVRSITCPLFVCR